MILFFSVSGQRPLHGAARFATVGEVQKAGLMKEGKGILVGSKLGKQYMSPDNYTALTAKPSLASFTSARNSSVFS